jgi:hypothetical protein
MRGIFLDRRRFVALLVAGSAVVAPAAARTAPPIQPDSHCSPVAYQPSWVINNQIKSYGGAYCPGGPDHAIGFNLYLLECTSTDISSCSEIDNRAYNFPNSDFDYMLGSGNAKPCNGTKWYRSKSRITVTLATATSAPYDMC